MVIDKCRVCKNSFLEKPLLEYKKMPAVAQNFPDTRTLNNDKGIDLKICQCSGCGLVQLDSEPVPYYREVIRASAVSGEMKKFRLKQFKDFVERYSLGNKKIIEIGCGNGEYLSLMQKACINAYGLEQAVQSVEKCMGKGLKVSQGFIQDKNTKITGAPFDAFFTLNFLEHLPNPNSMLRGIANNLTCKAIGLVEVPNFDMILRKKLFSEFTADHLFYFTKDTLETTLELNGFDILDCKEIWHDYSLSAIVRKKESINLSEFQIYQRQLKKEINAYIDKFENRNVAIWGAGHQALAIMALTEIGNRIKYVVDSAPFKQGKYTPATHIPIVSPNVLDSNPVEAIIVMAGSYSDEIAKIIQKKYCNKMEVALLKNFEFKKYQNGKNHTK